jgi:hypothetical protein
LPGVCPETRLAIQLYGYSPAPYTSFVPQVRSHSLAAISLRVFALAVTLHLPLSVPSHAQDAPPKAPQSSEKVATSPEAPAQIELLETRIRFEANGDSHKEVHTRVRINNELGTRQFSHVTFDYNRSFQQIEIPLMRITHASGGTADILPSAITDQPNPAVVNAPAYQDVRVKSVRILGLAPGDNLEYRVITTVSHHPLAPNFWLDHSFDRSGVVSQEIFEVDLPSSRNVEVRINSANPATATEKSGDGDSARTLYRWQCSEKTCDAAPQGATRERESTDPDVALSTFGWEPLSIQLDEKLTPGAKPLEQIRSYEESLREVSRQRGVSPKITARALEITRAAHTKAQKLEALYDFVSQKIATVGLPLGSTGFASRFPTEILASGYATAEDKFVLFAALSSAVDLRAVAALTGYCDSKGVPRPSVFTHLLISASDGQTTFWLDPSLEVAPFGVISPAGKNCAFVLAREFYALSSTGHEWQVISPRFPFASFQRVNVDANVAQDGSLHAKVHYIMRGENELLLRMAFHQSPREKWKDVAQLLALSDGFRGKIISASASDPYATKEPFTVEYEISQPKFVDWSKKPVRIPALLPLLSLPEPPEKSSPDAAPSSIDLGTPLDVETRATLHLPASSTAQVPFGSSVDRDYATFHSRYAKQATSVTATRHINFLLRTVPAARTADYTAFLHAVQTDQSQLFTLDHPDTPHASPSSSPQTTASPKPPR